MYAQRTECSKFRSSINIPILIIHEIKKQINTVFNIYIIVQIQSFHFFNVSFSDYPAYNTNESTGENPAAFYTDMTNNCSRHQRQP